MATYASGSIRFGGLNSDTDFDSMIEKLVAIESRQVTQLMRWKKDWQTRLDAFKEIRGELMNLQTTLGKMSSMGTFLLKTATSSNDKKVTAIADADAANISYNVKVQQKATNTYWTKETGLHDRTDVVCDTPGGGTFEYSYKGIYRKVDVPEGTTMEGLIKIINNDSKNPGVKAQMIQTIDGISFQLRGMDTGKTNTLVIRNTSNLIGLGVSPTGENYRDSEGSARLTTGFTDDGAGNGTRFDPLIPPGGEVKTFVYSVNDKRYTIDIQPGQDIDWLIAEINAATPQDPPLASLEAGDAAHGEDPTLLYFQLAKPDTTYTFPLDPEYTGGGTGPLEEILGKTYASMDSSVYDGDEDLKVSIGCLAQPPDQTYNNATITIPKGTTLSALTNALQLACGDRGKVAIDGTTGSYSIKITSVDKSHRVTVQSGTYEPLAYEPPSADGWDVSHAVNALVKINDIPSGDKWMEMPSNTLKSSEVIPGITFNIIGVTDAEGVDISVANDTEKMMENIQEFVTAVNTFRTLLASLTAYDEEKEQLDVEYAESQFEMQKGQVLTGNYGIQLVSSRLKSAIAGSSLGFLPLMKNEDGFVTGGDIFSSLSQIGITTNANEGDANYGLLEINLIPGTKGSKSLQECLTDDPEAVAKLFAAKGEGRSNSPDYFHYDSHLNTVTQAGTYSVFYEILPDGSINPDTALINGQKCGVSGNMITSMDGASKGLAINVIAKTPGQQYEGSVSIQDGKINEILGMLDGSEGMLGTNGTIRTLEKNYQSIIDGIEDKIKREDDRLTKFERNMILKFSRLEEVLSRYKGIQESLESQLAQLKTSSK